MSRIVPKTPAEYAPGQQELAQKCHEVVERAFGPNGETFQYLDPRGALMGPFPFVLYDSRTTQAFLDLLGGIGKMGFPADARDTTILAIAARFQAAFELYSHAAIAVKTGSLSAEQADMLRRGEKPADLNEQCSVAYDAVSYMLNSPGVLPQRHWDRLIATFGQDGTIAWVHNVGLYCCVSMVLNAIDAPVPE